MALSKGQFETEINTIEKLLTTINFLEERNFFPNEDFDPSEYRTKNYIDNWMSLIADRIYSFILIDNSILYYKYSGSELKFVFFECPYNCLTYKEFLIENDLVEEFEDRTFSDYYEEYIYQCTLKENPTMIRYELDVNAYFSGLHPVSHMHIGHKNNVRLGINKILNPKSFTSFILRQHYPALWKSLIIRDNDWIRYFKKEKDILVNVDKNNWNILDYSEFHLA